MPLRILLADENLAVQKLVELRLQSEGMEITLTDNSLSAVDLALKQTPDLIIADFNLEGLDLFVFIQKIRQSARLSDVPIILLIDATETFDPAQLRSVGVQAFFKKPIDSQELFEEIKRLTGDVVQGAGESLSLPGRADSDISEHFSEMQREGEEMEAALGWSDPIESPDDCAEVSPSEQTLVSSDRLSSPGILANEVSPEPDSEQAQVALNSNQIDESLLEQAIQEKVQESVEKVVRDVLPELLRSAFSKEVIASMLEKVTKEVVVPIAENEVKKEIERLQLADE